MLAGYNDQFALINMGVIRKTFAQNAAQRRGKMQINILSFDGGGIRGLYSARVAQNLLVHDPELISSTDLIAGTSTGAIIACALAAGIKPSDIVSLYYDNAARIFSDSWKNDVKSLDGLLGAEYDNSFESFLYTELFSIFGTKQLKDLNKKVLIPTFLLDSKNGVRAWKPKFFHNFDEQFSDKDERVVDVIMRSTAAPVYFPTFGSYIDGGVAANNPSMCAVAQILASVACELQDINLLSIGTCFSPEYIQGWNLDWGIAQWALPLVNIFQDGGAGTTHFICAKVLGSKYTRINRTLAKPIRLDSTNKEDLDLLISLADNISYAHATTAWADSINWRKKSAAGVDGAAPDVVLSGCGNEGAAAGIYG